MSYARLSVVLLISVCNMDHGRRMHNLGTRDGVPSKLLASLLLGNSQSIASVVYSSRSRSPVRVGSHQLMSSPAPNVCRSPQEIAVLWDLDGTLVDSTKLAFDATNEVLTNAGCKPCSVDDYKVGCKYTTPERFNFHLGLPTGDAQGSKLGQIFDETYVARVSSKTAGLFDGIDPLLRSLAMHGHPQGVLSNACGAYVRAVITANELDEDLGKRVAIMKVSFGADDVSKPKPHPDGLLECCRKMGMDPTVSIYVGDSPSDGAAARAAGMRSIGVLWGANDRDTLDGSFDVLVADIPALAGALRDFALPE